VNGTRREEVFPSRNIKHELRPYRQVKDSPETDHFFQRPLKRKEKCCTPPIDKRQPLFILYCLVEVDEWLSSFPLVRPGCLNLPPVETLFFLLQEKDHE